MDIQAKVSQLEQRRSEIESSAGQNLARERLAMLFDEGTFVEVGAFVKQRPTEFYPMSGAAEGVVTGYGSVDGKLVFAFAQDSAVLKGSISQMHAEKIVSIVKMAAKAGAPIVSMIDSCGLRLHEGVDALNGYGKILSTFSKIAGQIIHISVVFGTSAGALSFLPAMADYAVAVRKSEIFLSSPAVVLSRLGDAEAGTVEKAYCDGVVSVIAETDADACARVQEYINMVCDVSITEDDINRLTPEIAGIVSQPSYDVRDAIRVLADDGRFLELYAGQAANITVGFMGLNGSTIGVVANNPAFDDGALNAAASKKAAKFIDFCDAYDIPLLSLVDTDGFCAEKDENIEDCSLLLSAFVYADVPKVSVALGRAYGAGYLSMCAQATGADIAYALPSAQIAALPAETGAIFLGDQKIAQAEDPGEQRQALIEEYKEILSSPYEAAEHGYLDDIIDPATTRQLLASSFDMLADKSAYPFA